MHELHLAEDVLKSIKEEAGKKGLTKISYAKIHVGETLITDPPEFKELLMKISAGTVADSMRFDLEITPVKASCSDCGEEFRGDTLRFDCPGCGSARIGIVSGKEILIEALR
jgi:hydrogenase nickel incorporation protein HypA/HybF